MGGGICLIADLRHRPAGAALALFKRVPGILHRIRRAGGQRLAQPGDFRLQIDDLLFQTGADIIGGIGHRSPP
jgi:hypothetical protein